MSLFVEEKDRRVVPRWRDFRITLETGELDGQSTEALRIIDDPGYFEDKLAAWAREQNVDAAADLVASALVLGRHSEAAEAARFLLAPDCGATSAVKLIAELVSGPAEQAGRMELADLKEIDIDIEADVLRLRIRALRFQLHDAPRNALLWVDLSRAYSMLGQHEQSVRSMERALALIRTNRFILRSAARLFVHVDEPDRAHQILIRAESTRNDPWLTAAEIAVASVAGRKPLFVKQGRQILKGRRSTALQTAELASAMATLEMNAGDTRRARQLFRESLVDPTDNSLAQAGWAATKIQGVDIPPELLNRPRSFEARALKDYSEGRWTPAIRQCKNWLLDEPFSARPAALGSYLALVTEQDYRLSETFARRGLRANPGDSLLLNNLVVALANQGQVETASEEFAKISEKSDEIRPTLLATEGLLSFRKGDPKGGRRLYLEAVEQAGRQGDRRRRALAIAYLAREELLAGTSEAGEILLAAEQACEGIDLLEIPHMLRVIARLRETSRTGS